MAATVGPESGMATRWPSRPTRPSPIPSPIRAVTSGSPAATSEPKVKARMMTAATVPISSLPRGLVCEITVPSDPPASTCRPALRAGSAPAITLAATCLVS